MITRKEFRYSFEDLPFAPYAGESLGDGFVLRLGLDKLPEKGSEQTLLTLPGALTVATRQLRRGGPCDEYAAKENFFSCCEADGTVQVVEVSLRLCSEGHPEWNEMTVGVPLTLYDLTEADLYVRYDTVRLSLFVNGEKVNENMPFGTPPSVTGAAVAAPGVTAAFSPAADKVKRWETETVYDADFSYYMPAGFNTWAGDVINYWWNGTYHLIYFLDRRHHGSRFGCGGHYFHHVTTTDFVNWTDHGPAFELDAPWQTTGTGTLFEYDGKLCLSFGWHSNRTIPKEKLGSPAIVRHFEETGETCPLSYAALRAEGKFPDGANYAVSEDGIHFTVQPVEYHWAENPSIRTQPDGTLRLYCGAGTFQASHPQGPWSLYDPDFPVQGRETPMKNTEECPSFFEWNGYRYLIMGGTGFWCTEKDGTAYRDSAAEGRDIYDGQFVPMVTVTDTGRAIMGGWINGLGWGSCVIHRELIQYPDGHLGLKWMPELSPKATVPLLTQPTLEAGEMLALPPEQSLYLTMTVHPTQTGRMALRFTGAGEPAELQLDFAGERVQIATPTSSEMAATVPAACEVLPGYEGEGYFIFDMDVQDLHPLGKDFSLVRVDVMHEPFTLKIRQHYSRKMTGTLLDVEIAGQRTLISNRPWLSVTGLTLLSEGATVTDVAVYPDQADI